MSAGSLSGSSNRRDASVFSKRGWGKKFCSIPPCLKTLPRSEDESPEAGALPYAEALNFAYNKERERVCFYYYWIAARVNNFATHDSGIY
jgi:hypothetical protein